jgi:hypothetical protein
MAMYREVNEMPHCANCGVLVPAAELVRERRGFQLVFCSAKCVEVYDRYKFPRYREQIEAMERKGSGNLAHGYLVESMIGVP